VSASPLLAGEIILGREPQTEASFRIFFPGCDVLWAQGSVLQVQGVSMDCSFLCLFWCCPTNQFTDTNESRNNDFQRKKKSARVHTKPRFAIACFNRLCSFENKVKKGK